MMRLIYLVVIALLSSQAQATLNLVLTQGVNSAQPIAVVPFGGQSDASGTDNIAQIITNDLQNSGRFKTLPSQQMTQLPHDAQSVEFSSWRLAGVDSVVVGQMHSLPDGRYQVNFSLLDVFKGRTENNETGGNNPVLQSRQFVVAKNDLRRLAHYMSDLIYEQLTGQRGVFSTRIAYVLVQREGNQASRFVLEVADADGYNPRPLLTSREPIMSPAWSKDGRRIAYVSFENKRAQIYMTDVTTGGRRLISSFPGINGAPTWSPDSRKLALVLSREGHPKIYTIDIASGRLQQLTQGDAIDTEPNWSPDGRSIIFTSDRGGSPQIYKIDLASGKITRVTFVGEYNARASYSSDGKHIIMLHREKGMYNIALQDLESGAVQVLTNSGRDESPSIAPNGSMVIFGSEYGILGLVSTDGRIKLRLPSGEGRVKDPAWSPFLT